MSTPTRPHVVMVTGAGADLGRAIATSFAKRGAHVGLLSRDPVRLEAGMRRGPGPGWGGKGLVLPADVADAAQVEEAAATLGVWPDRHVGQHRDVLRLLSVQRR